MAYHKAREAFAAGFAVAGHIDRTEFNQTYKPNHLVHQNFTNTIVLLFLEEYQRITSAICRRSYITKCEESLVKAMYWLILHHTGIATSKECSGD